MKKYHFEIIARSWLYDVMKPLFLRLPSNSLRIVFLQLFNRKVVGKNVYIAPKTDIREPWKIFMGSNIVINKNVLLDGRGGLEIGNNVDIAQDTIIWTAQHDYNDDYHKYITGKVVIGDYVWLASRTMILPGVIIGKGAVVAAGAVVSKDVKTMELVGGVPAKVLGIRKSKLLYTLHKE